MAHDGGLSGYQPYPLDNSGPQAIARYGPMRTAIVPSTSSHQEAVPQGLSAATTMMITSAGATASESQEIEVTAEQGGRRITQTQRVIRAAMPESARYAEDRCAMLQNEISAIVRIANDRED